VFTTFFPENCAVHEIMWKNMVDLDRPQMTMTHAHCVLYTQGYRHTLTICNIYYFSAATMVARTRLIVTSNYVACLMLVSFCLPATFQLLLHASQVSLPIQIHKKNKPPCSEGCRIIFYNYEKSIFSLIILLFIMTFCLFQSSGQNPFRPLPRYET